MLLAVSMQRSALSRCGDCVVTGELMERMSGDMAVGGNRVAVPTHVLSHQYAAAAFLAYVGTDPIT
jgi:hypothetical protein